MVYGAFMRPAAAAVSPVHSGERDGGPACEMDRGWMALSCGWGKGTAGTRSGIEAGGTETGGGDPVFVPGAGFKPGFLFAPSASGGGLVTYRTSGLSSSDGKGFSQFQV